MKIMRASVFLKQIISMITTIAKAKTMALKSKTRAIKTRLIIFSLLTNKKVLMSSIMDKIRALTGQEDKKYLEEEELGDHQSKGGAIVVYNAMSHHSLPNPTQNELSDYKEEEEEEEKEEANDDGEKYQESTHYSLFDGSADMEEFENAGGSVIDMVKNSKPEGEEFRLEDEIDHVADLFIKRFHLQMKIQKQLSFRRNQEMLESKA